MPLAASALLAASGLLAAGCSKTFRGHVVQPNPLSTPNETLRESETVVIITGDMELVLPQPITYETGDSIQINRRYPLTNAARFTVVSRDRLRFHVQVEHKWLEWADLDTWSAYLVDDKGRRYRPETVERTREVHVVSMWDYETRTVVRNRFNDVVHIFDDGYKHRKPLGSLSVFRGLGDFVFHARDIFTPEIEHLTLVIRRSNLAFAFTWRFKDKEVDQETSRETGCEIDTPDIRDLGQNGREQGRQGAHQWCYTGAGPSMLAADAYIIRKP